MAIGPSVEDKPPLKKLKFSILFEEASIPFIELYPLGIGRGMLKRIPTKRLDPENSKMALHTQFNLNNFVDNEKKFIWYEAESILDNCEPVHFLVLFDRLWVSKDQLAEFRESFHTRLKTTDKLNNETLWANFITQA